MAGINILINLNFEIFSLMCIPGLDDALALEGDGFLELQLQPEVQ